MLTVCADVAKCAKKAHKEHTTLKEATDWIDENGSEASTDDIEEKLAEIQTAINPITSKIYADSSAGGQDWDAQEPFADHDEL